MRLFCFLILLFVSKISFAQIIDKKSNEYSDLLINAKKEVVTSKVMLIGSGIILGYVATYDDNMKAHRIRKSVKPWVVIGSAIFVSSVALKLDAWNKVKKAGKTSNTIGLTVSPAGASIAVTF